MSYIGNEPFSAAFLTDTFSGNGSTTAFTLSAAPANTSSIIVAVTGVLQDPSTYGVSGTTLTFSGAPPTGTNNISVRFLGIPASGVTTTAYRTVTEFTATAGQTSFSVPSYTVGFIDVYRNGVMLGSADYTATNGTTVVLASGATAGDLVEVISFQVSSVLNAIPASPASVQTSYLVDGSVTTAKIANGVTINFADGSASAPSITNDGDTNTGMFFPAADTIAFAEGGTEVMRIDSAGRVLKPYQPAFVGLIASTPSSSSQNKVTFASGDVQINVGSNYSTGTGRFTAPVAGLYVILIQSRTAGGGESYFGCNARKNGFDALLWTYNDASGYSDDSSWCHGIISMVANDYVEFYTYTNSSINVAYQGSIYLLG